MTALTYEDALEATKPKFIYPQGRCVELKSARMLSTADSIRLIHLLEEYKREDEDDNAVVSFLRGVILPDVFTRRRALIRPLADLLTVSALPDQLSRRTLANIVKIGLEYLNDSAPDSGGESHDDVGAMIGMLHKHYGGSVSSWWDAPAWQLSAAAKATDPNNKVESTATDLDFMLQMSEMGIEVS